MFTIAKTFYFAAAHHLPSLPDGHKCRRVHGHNYCVTVVLESDTLDEHSFVADYGDLSVVKALIDDRLDHRDLNEVLPFEPTAEKFAEWLWTEFARFPWGVMLHTVVVQETDKTMAAFSPMGHPIVWTS